MTTNSNPYQPPEASESHPRGYDVTPFRKKGKNGARVLLQVIEERAQAGWRLVTQIGVVGHEHLVWRCDPLAGSNAKPPAGFRVLPLPGFIESIRNRSFSPWPASIAREMSHLEPDWHFSAYCCNVGFVLQRDDPSRTTTSSSAEQFTVIRRRPVSWRTLFGNSWLRVLTDELNEHPQTEGEIVAYLGDDLFLTRKPQSNGQAFPLAKKLYRLIMCPRWRRAAFLGASHYVSWFDEEANHDWELLSHYEGAVFLFSHCPYSSAQTN